MTKRNGCLCACIYNHVCARFPSKRCSPSHDINWLLLIFNSMCYLLSTIHISHPKRIICFETSHLRDSESRLLTFKKLFTTLACLIYSSSCIVWQKMQCWHETWPFNVCHIIMYLMGTRFLMNSWSTEVADLPNLWLQAPVEGGSSSNWQITISSWSSWF